MASFSTTATVETIPESPWMMAAFCHQLLAVVETMVPESLTTLRGSAGALWAAWSR